MRQPIRLFVLALCCTLGATAAAQTPSPMAEWQYSGGVVLASRFEANPPEWSVRAGVGAEELPRYPGSARYRTQPGLDIDVRYRDRAFFSLGEGLGVNLTAGHAHRIGVALTYDLGRKEKRDPHLRGLGDIGPCPELKFFAEYVMFPLVVRMDVRRGFGGHRGWIGDLGAYLPLAGSSHFFVMAGPGVMFGDSRYQQSYFGITAAQSARSVYAPYSAGGGLSSASFGLDAAWIINPHWMLEGQGAAQRLLGSGVDSPLRLSQNQIVGGLFLSYLY